MQRSERVERRLGLRLDELGAALERSPDAVSVDRLVALAVAATEHAVTLELLTSDRAAEVWAAARARHPVLGRYEYS